jgi:hypothetical protein
MDHYQFDFIELAIELPVVVACRCSPTQKVLYAILLSYGLTNSFTYFIYVG